jgi:hypothetical protein
MSAEMPNPFVDAKPDTPGGLPLLVSAAEMEANPPIVPPVLVECLLYVGGTMMFSGPSKARKTFIMLALAICIASGRKFLGFPTSKGAVIYINLELQDFAMEQRLTAICGAMGIPRPANLYLWNLRGHRVTLTILQQQLPALIRQVGAVLVIIDPHYKISAVSGFEENSNDGQGELLAAFEGICNTNGAALCIAHHHSKGDQSGKSAIDRASGGGVMARWPDVVATLTPHEEEECMALEFSLRNFKPVAPMVLRWEHPQWHTAEELDPSKLKKAGRTNEHPASELLSLLVDGMTNKDWHQSSGWADGTFRRRRDELLKSKRVRQSGACFYRTTPQSPQSPQSNLAA